MTNLWWTVLYVISGDIDFKGIESISGFGARRVYKLSGDL